MRDNGRTPMAASKLPPNLLILHPGARPVVACPDCGTWRVVCRRMLPAHRALDGVRRCPGSGQRVTIDLTGAQWRENLRVAVRVTATLRGGRGHRTRRPPASVPMFREAVERDYRHGRSTGGAPDGHGDRTP